MSIATAEESAEEPISSVLNELIFGWWNTSLSPVGNERSDDDHKNISSEIVKSLFNDYKVDCLALGEVTFADLERIKDACGDASLAIFDGTLKKGRLQFDTGIIYNRNTLSVYDSFSFTGSHGNHNLKVANRIDFTSTIDGEPLFVFVTHWPSRTLSENLLKRKAAASRLRDHITEIENTLPDASIIVMGDFNDEPFDESIYWNLMATRDRQFTKNGNGYLYNPFWKQMGESQPYFSKQIKNGAGGSYFHKGGLETQWRTFDQIIFSKAFLGSGTWHLDERRTSVLETETLINLVKNPKFSFDHLPVLGVVDRTIKINQYVKL